MSIGTQTHCKVVYTQRLSLGTPFTLWRRRLLPLYSLPSSSYPFSSYLAPIRCQQQPSDSHPASSSRMLPTHWREQPSPRPPPELFHTERPPGQALLLLLPARAVCTQPRERPISLHSKQGTVSGMIQAFKHRGRKGPTISQTAPAVQQPAIGSAFCPEHSSTGLSPGLG